MRTFTIILLSVVLSQHLCNALPGGPPVRACGNMMPDHLPFDETNNIGYNISVPSEFLPGSTVSMTITGTSSLNQFRGIFLQVRDGPDLLSSNRVGDWNLPNDNYRYIFCTNSNANDAISHSNRRDKNVGQVFQWNAPTCSPGTQYFVKVTVVRNYAQFETAISIPITCSSSPRIPGEEMVPPERTTNPTIQTSTTLAPTTQLPTTLAPTTQLPTTLAPTTQLPTTLAPTTQSSTTLAPTTQSSTTLAPTTQSPTTQTSTNRALRLFPDGCDLPNFTNIPEVYNNNFENISDIFRGWNIAMSQEHYSWRWNSGPTPSRFTGPSAAFEGLGYIYTEASNPSQLDDEALLYTENDLRGCFCFSFAYSFNANIPDTPGGHTFEVWVGESQSFVTSAFSEDWIVERIQVYSQDAVQIGILATRGMDWIGDIAIDDIVLTPGLC